jgi:hypothetical protein
LTDAYAALDATGHATGIDAILIYPIRRIEAQTLNASLDIAYKNLIDDIGATDTRTPRDTVAATAALNLRDNGALMGAEGRTQATGAVTVGHLRMPQPSRWMAPARIRPERTASSMPVCR